jgi:hypothetical protein
MEIVCSSEMSTWHHIPEDGTLPRLKVFMKRELRKIFGPKSRNNREHYVMRSLQFVVVTKYYYAVLILDG